MRDVGDHAAEGGKKELRTISDQHLLPQFLRNIAQAKEAAIAELEMVDDVDLVFGVNLEVERHLVEVFVLLGHADINVNLKLRLFPRTP